MTNIIFFYSLDCHLHKLWQRHAHLSHQLSVLGVHAGNGPDVLAGLQGLVELRVLQHHAVLVSHVHLEGVDPMLPHQGLHLTAHLEERTNVVGAGWRGEERRGRERRGEEGRGEERRGEEGRGEEVRSRPWYAMVGLFTEHHVIESMILLESPTYTLKVDAFICTRALLLLLVFSITLWYVYIYIYIYILYIYIYMHVLFIIYVLCSLLLLYVQMYRFICPHLLFICCLFIVVLHEYIILHLIITLPSIFLILLIVYSKMYG